MTDPAVKQLISNAEDAVAAYAPRCWLWHRWSRWEDVTHGNLGVGGRIIGEVLTQRRRCLRCNAAELRMAKATIA